MGRSTSRALWSAAFVGLIAMASGAASAQTYPSATVKLIVPVPAGGVTDTMARIVAQRLTEAWGQPVVPSGRQLCRRSASGGEIAAGRADAPGRARLHRHRQSASLQQASLRS